MPGDEARETVFVDTFTDGMLDPKGPMLGPVRDGGFIVANTSPGCWGPMITPSIRGGHELTQPVAVEGAEVGDAVAIRIHDITVTSAVSASGVHLVHEGRHEGNPSLLARCPECGGRWPETRLEGVGEGAVRCANCGAEASPFGVAHGYTMGFDPARRFGVTLTPEKAREVAREPHKHAAMPDKSAVHPFLVMAAADMPGVATRLRVFMGQLGTVPGVRITGAANAGDAIRSLIDADHEFAITAGEAELRTDGHMDCDAVRTGAILICPVKVPGAGVYTGDMHAMQGDGEIAGHTTDVSGTITMQVEVIKGLSLDGPVLLPLYEDLQFLARPFSAEERMQVLRLAEEWGVPELEESAPISVIGSGATINDATTNALERAADLLGISVEEVRNRATITGAIEIARLGGVAQATFLAPLELLDRARIGKYVREQYAV